VGEPLPVQVIGELGELEHLDHLPFLAAGLSCGAAWAHMGEASGIPAIGVPSSFRRSTPAVPPRSRPWGFWTNSNAISWPSVSGDHVDLSPGLMSCSSGSTGCQPGRVTAADAAHNARHRPASALEVQRPLRWRASRFAR